MCPKHNFLRLFDFSFNENWGNVAAFSMYKTFTTPIKKKPTE